MPKEHVFGKDWDLNNASPVLKGGKTIILGVLNSIDENLVSRD